MRLKAGFGYGVNNTYSDTGIISYNTVAGNMSVVDLGQITINPLYTLTSRDAVTGIKVTLQMYATVDDSVNITVYDVVLIPADEWSGFFSASNYDLDALLYEGRSLDIDSIVNPRQYRAVMSEAVPTINNIVAQTQINYLGEYARVASSEPIFQSNADQRLWFFNLKKTSATASYSYTGCIGRVRAECSARYLLMRGDR